MSLCASELVARLQAVEDSEEIRCDHMFTAAIHDVLRQGGEFTCNRHSHRGVEYSNKDGTFFVHRIGTTWHAGRMPA